MHKQCTTGEYRVKRWEHEAVIDAMQVRLENDPTISTEMNLHVLAYNLKRMMNIFGISGLLEAISA